MTKWLVAAVVAVLFAGAASAQVAVRGYTRSDGTYVAPHVRSSPNGTTADNYRAPASPSYVAPRPTYATPPATTPCSGDGCYGQPSSSTGAPRTNRVEGYTRSDGTYVAPYYRSSPQR